MSRLKFGSRGLKVSEQMGDFLLKFHLLLVCRLKLLKGSHLLSIGGHHFIYPYSMEVSNHPIAGLQIEHIMYQL